MESYGLHFSSSLFHMGEARSKGHSEEATIENLENKLLRAQRLVYDALKCCKEDTHNIEITAKMVTSWKTARSKYVRTRERK